DTIGGERSLFNRRGGRRHDRGADETLIPRTRPPCRDDERASDRRHRGSENRRADDEQREIVERTPSDRREMNGPDEPQRRKRQSRRAPLGKEVDQDRRREADERKRRQRVQPDHNTLEHITTYCDAAAPAETAGGRARAARRSPSMNTETLRR